MKIIIKIHIYEIPVTFLKQTSCFKEIDLTPNYSTFNSRLFE